MGGGLRIGWMTGPQAIVDKVMLLEQATNLHPSALSQHAIIKVLKTIDFDSHISKIADFYSQRYTKFCSLILEILGDKVEFVKPDGGMFIWLKLKGVTDTKAFVEEKCIKANLILVPGCEFYPHWDTSSYVRCSFSTASDEQMEKGLRILESLF